MAPGEEDMGWGWGEHPQATRIPRLSLPFTSFVGVLPLPRLQSKLLLSPQLRGKVISSRKPALTSQVKFAVPVLFLTAPDLPHF